MTRAYKLSTSRKFASLEDRADDTLYIVSLLYQHFHLCSFLHVLSNI